MQYKDHLILTKEVLDLERGAGVHDLSVDREVRVHEAEDVAVALGHV